jgi:hypothetical protein
MNYFGSLGTVDWACDRVTVIGQHPVFNGAGLRAGVSDVESGGSRQRLRQLYVLGVRFRRRCAHGHRFCGAMAAGR